MSSAADNLIRRAKTAAKYDGPKRAQDMLESALLADPDRDQRLEIWLLKSDVAEDREEKQACLEYALGLAPWDARVHRGLALLRGDLKPEDMVDPNAPQAAAPSQPVDIESRRYVCRNCGGRLTFVPGSHQLTCAYCGHGTALEEALLDDPLGERDFSVALATAKGHSHPVATRTLDCQGCGASYLLSPATISMNCPYCQSPLVIESPATRELLAPDGIIPFAVDANAAYRAFRAWLAEKGLEDEASTRPPAGAYLPVWTFDVGGEIRWVGMRTEREEGLIWHSENGWRQVQVSGSLPVLYDDLLVPASHTLPSSLMPVVRSFDLHTLLSFDSDYVAGWPAEIYQISAADASLVARQQAWEDGAEKARLQSGDIEELRDVRMNSVHIGVMSFKLILLPLWVAGYTYRDETYRIVVNGQNGSVTGEAPQGRLRRFLGHLLGED